MSSTSTGPHGRVLLHLRNGMLRGIIPSCLPVTITQAYHSLRRAGLDMNLLSTVISLVARVPLANNILSIRSLARCTTRALPLRPRKRPQRPVSSEHSQAMRMSVGYGGPARRQAGRASCDACPLACHSFRVRYPGLS